MAWIHHITDSAGSMTQAEMVNNANEFHDYFDGYMTRAAMAGLLGNIQHESYINPGQMQIGSGISLSSNSGGGLIQWTPRNLFIAWCNSRGYNWVDGDTQCYRIKCEGEKKDGCSGYWFPKNGYNYTWSEFCQLTDYEEACKAYLHERERAGVSALSSRLKYAKAWYEYFDDGEEPEIDPDQPTPSPSPYDNNLVRYGGVRDLMRRGVISNGKL